MAGITPNEGEAFVADLVYKRDLDDRAPNLSLGLFTNSSTAVVETINATDITQPVGTGTALITLGDTSWTGAADTRAFAQQTFTNTGSTTWGGTVKGYFIQTIASTEAGAAIRLLHIENDTNGPYTMNVNDTYDVTPNCTVA
jgi:hypothetical protein